MADLGSDGCGNGSSPVTGQAWKLIQWLRRFKGRRRVSSSSSETVNEKIVGPEGKCGCWENFIRVLGWGNGFSCRQVELVAP